MDSPHRPVGLPGAARVGRIRPARPLQRIPRPTAEGDATRPGWHVRTLQTQSGPRKYTVYVPKGHDGTKPVPAVLFLHGAGERGEDGIRPAQVGLGPREDCPQCVDHMKNGHPTHMIVR